MTEHLMLSEEQLKYLQLLAAQYPSRQAACTEIINLQAILNLPKGTEHFISDVHGEYEAFTHILNNCSGVIREKVEQVFAQRMSKAAQGDLCTLIYYPKEKLKMIRHQHRDTPAWYKATLQDLIDLAKNLSSKYTRSKVRKAMPEAFAYIIDELLHAQPDEDNNQLVYHEQIIESVINTDCGRDFILALAALIKRLAVDHLHIVGDIFDRGAHADKIMDLLMSHHSLDIEWGNHDILWMGAASGSEACIAAVIRNNIAYGNMEMLESGYGISLRSLVMFAATCYQGQEDVLAAARKAISVILFKLEGQLIRRHPEYNMQEHLLLDKIDYDNATVRVGAHTYAMRDVDLPTVAQDDPYRLCPEEEQVMEELRAAFQNSARLHRHIGFLYARGAMYRCFNNNLLFHGCIPLDHDGNFDSVTFDGRTYQGKAYMDYADRMARQAYFGKENQNALDFMWYLWCGKKSPLSGRSVRTFERTFIADESAWEEPKNAYYTFCHTEQTCNMILREFGLYDAPCHIINGHTPVRAMDGESPIKAGGKLIVIDGGFCKAYQASTGIAGYTLIFNSHGMRIKAHRPFESVEAALQENKDIESKTNAFETKRRRMMVKDTDAGREIAENIADLQLLVAAYREGIIPQNKKR
nr:fructose-1,6-bisphosphatase [Maliibacterium massiliense]